MAKTSWLSGWFLTSCRPRVGQTPPFVLNELSGRDELDWSRCAIVVDGCLHERKAEHFLAFVTISAALISHRRLMG